MICFRTIHDSTSTESRAGRKKMFHLIHTSCAKNTFPRVVSRGRTGWQKLAEIIGLLFFGLLISTETTK